MYSEILMYVCAYALLPCLECEGFDKFPEDQEIQKDRSKIKTKRKKEIVNCSLYKAAKKSMQEEITAGETEES